MKGKLPCWRATERVGLSTVQRCAMPRCVLFGFGVVGQMYKLHGGTGVKGKAFMPHALLRTTRHKRRLYWLYGLDQLHGQKDALSAHVRNRLFVCCSVVPFLFFSYVFFFMYKRTTAPWAGQESEKQPKFKDKLIHEARRAVKNITTALASVDSFFFHNTPEAANEELSINYHVCWGLSITLPHAYLQQQQLPQNKKPGSLVRLPGMKFW